MDEFETGATASDAALAANGEALSKTETSYETGPLIWEGEWDKSDMI